MNKRAAKSDRQGFRVGRAAIALGLLLLSMQSGVAIAADRAGSQQPYDLALPKGTHVSVLLSHDDVANGASATAPFDVAPDGLPVVADGSAFKVFGASSKSVPVGSSAAIDDFAWMRNRALLLITGQRLASIGADGLALSHPLPTPGMHLRPAGQNTAYVFGGANEPANHDLYLFARDGTMAKFVTLPAPIADVAGDGTTTYVATGQTILRVAEQQPVTAVLRAHDAITSIACAGNGGLFYATKAGVGYVASNGAAYEFMKSKGGVVRVQGAALFLLLPGSDPSLSRARLLRFTPVDGFEQFQRIGSQASSGADARPSAKAGDAVGPRDGMRRQRF